MLGHTDTTTYRHFVCLMSHNISEFWGVFLNSVQSRNNFNKAISYLGN